MFKFITGVITGIIVCFILVRTLEGGKVSDETNMDNKSTSQAVVQESTGVISKSENSNISKALEHKNKELEAEVIELKGLLAGKEVRKQSSAKPKVQVSKKQFYQQVPDSHKELFNYENLGQSQSFKLIESVHAEFVSEEQDQSWALAMEQQIESYLYRHPRSELFQLRIVECKSTMCEIYATVLSQDNSIWGHVMSEMESQAWWEDFHIVSIQKRDNQGGLSAYSAIGNK